MISPKVTVLMPVYNGEKFLKDAIDSILGQTFTDFEFLIINDGSTDQTEEIVKSYKDKRIVLVNNEINLKLINTLNKGLELSHGEYIARMDSDDISLPDRIKKQVEFMDNNTDIGLCGSYVYTFGVGKPKLSKRYYLPNDIKCSFLFWGALAHPSVIMRRSILEENNLSYDLGYLHAEDYRLWTQFCKVSEIANYPEGLLYYRIHPQSIGQTYTDKMYENTEKAISETLHDFGIEYNEREFYLHTAIAFARKVKNLQSLKECGEWLQKIMKHNESCQYYDTKALERVLFDYWREFCCNNSELGFPVLVNCISSPLFKIKERNYLSNILKVVKHFYVRRFILSLKKNTRVNTLLKKLRG